MMRKIKLIENNKKVLKNVFTNKIRYVIMIT